MLAGSPVEGIPRGGVGQCPAHREDGECASAAKEEALRQVQQTGRPHRCVIQHLKEFSVAAGFECRCGGLYCSEHRYDKAHDCTFDYKTVEREELRRKNPVVVGDKIRRI